MDVVGLALFADSVGFANYVFVCPILIERLLDHKRSALTGN